jgi:hypothetical protein
VLQDCPKWQTVFAGCGGKPTTQKKNRMCSDLEKIAERVRSFMRRSIGEKNLDEEFNGLALELFAAQKRQNNAYARLCDKRFNSPVENWADIPAAATFAFKELELTSLEPSERAEVFFSSGADIFTRQSRWIFTKNPFGSGSKSNSGRSLRGCNACF